MRISELAAATGVSVPTLKFYLREGVLHPGWARSRTQSDYDDSHAERVRLVRALMEVGGLDLATVGRVLATIESPDFERLGVLAVAQQALLGAAPEASGSPDDPVCRPRASDSSVASDGADGSGAGPSDVAADQRGSRAQRWLRDRGWQVAPDDPAVAPLERAWQACGEAGIGLDESRMDFYADAAEQIAAVDVASVPADPVAAVRQVVVGTVLVDPVLSALRKLAQQHTAVTQQAAES